MNELYLIAHLVRGIPAFDIANRCDDMGTPSDPSPWWIIPTSGHRAYPYWSTPIDNTFLWHNCQDCPQPPSNWPDHYTISDAKDQAKLDAWEERQAKGNQSKGRQLLLNLGMVKPLDPIRRRV